MIFKQLQVNIARYDEDLCQKVTEEILDLSNQNISLKGQFNLVLSGGQTPQGIYQCMASDAYRDKFNWERINFFFGDERWVAHEEINSNFHMVSQALFSKVKIPSGNIHPIPTMMNSIENCAFFYEEDIRHFFKLKKNELPSFDLILLGLGQDGHIASIFPQNPVLLMKDSLVAAVSQEGKDNRITLTLTVINEAKTIFFLVRGQEKAQIVHNVLENDHADLLPARQIKPVHGKLAWFLDGDAASQLSKEGLGASKRIGVAADHGGYLLKEQLTEMLRVSYEVIDYGNQKLDPADDFPDFIVPLARAVSSTKVDRGVAICGSGVGACIAANKVPGVRACMIHEKFSARQGVEDDNMNVICLGSKVLDKTQAWELVRVFLSSRFSNAQRHIRRLSKIKDLEIN